MNTLSTFHRHHQRGVGLLEVMIAVLVLGIGVLGVMALQTVALRNTDSSAMKSQATVQVYAMFDLLRANNNKKAGAKTDLSAFETNWTSASGSGTPKIGTLDHWLASLKDTLGPDAQGKVHCKNGQYGRRPPRLGNGEYEFSSPDDQNENTVCTVGVKWNDSRAGGKEKEEEEIEIGILL